MAPAVKVLVPVVLILPVAVPTADVIPAALAVFNVAPADRIKVPVPETNNVLQSIVEFVAIVSVPATVVAVVTVCKVRFNKFGAVPSPNVKVRPAIMFMAAVALVLLIVIVEGPVPVKVRFAVPPIFKEFKLIDGTLLIVPATDRLITTSSPATGTPPIQLPATAQEPPPATFQVFVTLKDKLLNSNEIIKRSINRLISKAVLNKPDLLLFDVLAGEKIGKSRLNNKYLGFLNSIYIIFKYFKII